jgi:hypothetical protein
MPIYRINNRNILFLHVPKTGGTSVEAFFAKHVPTGLQSGSTRLFRPTGRRLAVRPLPLQHFHAALLEAMFTPDYFDYAFMIVRDPLERLKSEYLYSRRLGRIDTFLSFSMWAEVVLRLAAFEPTLRSNHIRPQVDFLCFQAEVFRFEEGMDKILDTVSSKTGLPRPEAIPHERPSPPSNIEISARGICKVREYYAEDYKRFGY